MVGSEEITVDLTRAADAIRRQGAAASSARNSTFRGNRINIHFNALSAGSADFIALHGACRGIGYPRSIERCAAHDQFCRTDPQATRASRQPLSENSAIGIRVCHRLCGSDLQEQRAHILSRQRAESIRHCCRPRSAYVVRDCVGQQDIHGDALCPAASQQVLRLHARQLHLPERSVADQLDARRHSAR